MLVDLKDKPVQVISIKAETSNNANLCWGLNVEITLKCEMNNIMKRIYIHLNQYLKSHYTVSDASMFDYVTGKVDELHHIKFIEEYDSLEETKKSAYYDYFNLADAIAHDLVKFD